MSSSADLARSLAPALREVVRQGGEIAEEYFRLDLKTSARVWNKAGGSPVTEADVAVDTFLKIRLAELLPDAGWLSEETADDPSRLAKSQVWIVDPIDGTRAFMSGHPDWSVAVALLVDARPVLGIVHAPAAGAVYEAVAGLGATCNGKAISASGQASLQGARVAGPKPLIDTLERRVGALNRHPRIPSLALRLARVAAGDVDIGLVSGDARDWDIAAADLILHEAGARLTTLEGGAVRYNRVEPLHGELAAASDRLHPALIEAMTAHRDAGPAMR